MIEVFLRRIGKEYLPDDRKDDDDREDEVP